MLEVRETRLPGVGSKFAMRTARDERLCSVVHLDGLREIYHYTDEDDEPHVITLNDEEARQLGAILAGVVYRPQLVQDLEVALKDLVMEWIPLPADSPLVGLTVATCRIRSTTGSTIVAILRDSGSLATPHPDEVLRADDTLVVIGRPETFSEVRRLVAEGPPA
ncbi:MAG: TrkA domain protein [Miltoncostaeaceae bacterium]|nr:TrkA domain protein [Miltoncostaeaceae bacterium]